MRLFHQLLALIGLRSKVSNDKLLMALEGFDVYAQRFISAGDETWDASSRLASVEYVAFLYGAAYAIVRGNGKEAEYLVAILGPYLSRFMDFRESTLRLLKCEAEMAKSVRLQGVQEAGNYTAQAVFVAGSQGRAQELNRSENIQLLIQIFSELHELMAQRPATEGLITAASEKLYDAIVGK